MARKGGVMWFHFCAANHDPIGRQTLGDMFAWFRAGLLDAGHKVTWHDTKTERGAVNIFWENFSPGWGKLLADSGITYGIVATEVPDGMGSFNWRNDSGWPQRFAAFGEVAERAAFIWAMVESTVPFYARFAKTAYLELGYSDRLLPIESMPDPDLDFSFFGLRTPYREQVAAELRQHFNFVWPDKFLSADEVSQIIARTRVNVSLLQSPQWPIISPTRVGRVVLAQRGIASERTPELIRQAQLIPICPEGMPFVEFARVRLPVWRKEAKSNLERYREYLPMRSIVENVLEVTVSGLRQPHSRLLKNCALWNVASHVVRRLLR